MNDHSVERAVGSKPFFITPIYERLLLDCKAMPYGGIYHLHMLRAEQLCRLYYSPKSLKRVQSLLKDLVDKPERNNNDEGPQTSRWEEID